MFKIGCCFLAAAFVCCPEAALAQVRPQIAPPSAVSAPSQAASATRLTLKRKIAIGRFSNATRYGKALLRDGERDPLAGQAADMLMARLVDSGRFIVFERSDTDALVRERTLNGAGATEGLSGVDVLIVGSVTEFGRQVEGKAGFLNSKARQVASATVEVRLVDVQTGQAFFSTSGSGTASVEVSEVMGFGGRAAYDSTLNDKAISAAISDLMTNVTQKLEARPWSTDVLQVRGEQVFISGGPSQGLRPGDRFALETRGELVRSTQTGTSIRLPGESLGEIEVVSFFGEGEGEGAIAKLVRGHIPDGPTRNFLVRENRP